MQQPKHYAQIKVELHARCSKNKEAVSLCEARQLLLHTAYSLLMQEEHYSLVLSSFRQDLQQAEEDRKLFSGNLIMGEIQ